MQRFVSRDLTDFLLFCIGVGIYFCNLEYMNYYYSMFLIYRVVKIINVWINWYIKKCNFIIFI